MSTRRRRSRKSIGQSACQPQGPFAGKPQLQPPERHDLTLVGGTGHSEDQGATSGVASPVIRALEICLAALQSRHADVPEAVIVIGGQQRRRSGVLYGRYAPRCWQRDDERLPEILVTGEGMKRGASAVMATLVHEAAHAVAGVRGVSDTSRRGRYHNRRFLLIGEELGLDVSYDETIGWSPSRLSEASEQEYAPELELLSRELTIYRPMKLRVVPPAPPRSKPVCECGCGRRIRIAARVLERGVIRCGLCEGAFAWRQVPA